MSEPKSEARRGIFYKAALLSVIVAILTSGSLVIGIIFHEQELLNRQQKQRSQILVASIEGVTGDFVDEEYAEVTDHCMAMVNASKGVRYAVITRDSDGFSLVHESGGGWRDTTLGGHWRPDDEREDFLVRENEFSGSDEVLHHSYPFAHQGIHFGWIHVGLSLDALRANRQNVLRIVGLISLPALAIGVGSSFLFARKLTRPILRLKKFAERVASGDLEGVAGVRSQDEVGALAVAMNDMTRDLRHSQEQLAAAARKEAEMREIVIREIHHRVKNNMQVLSSLMRMQGRSIDSGLLKNVLRDSEARIRSMGLIHEKLYQSENLSDIDFQDYSEGLTSQMASFLGANDKGIRCEVDAPGIMLPLDTALPCGLIVNELISNSFKYAFPNGDRGGLVCVAVKASGDGEYHLVVSDNGVGLNGNARKGALGLKLVNMLAEQLDGSAEFKSSPGQGVRVEIKFKESHYVNRV